ncbi:uncharacterized protein TRIVIDRAFT_216035 [Trichoderma virens Gv29-8]|uniref:Uncharacterized protein n=1 Tax=Hypocrea virens (strain Gv29-8 / FGSC 10586) TaxID=413071 RepID=G9MQW3_HYPVG|nr:uncharacterized protein TRIVIDRAFT_216035 [Trichoderma virens Gv29-8]EHK22492.1 hypothetical protein TRIVIDRAFT_216035 [Trichoderma virens Gv29-8]
MVSLSKWSTLLPLQWTRRGRRKMFVISAINAQFASNGLTRPSMVMTEPLSCRIPKTETSFSSRIRMTRSCLLRLRRPLPILSKLTTLTTIVTPESQNLRSPSSLNRRATLELPLGGCRALSEGNTRAT